MFAVRNTIVVIFVHIIHDSTVWNEELLRVGGYLARTAYEREMETITSLWKEVESDQAANTDVRNHLGQRALHALKFYTFHTSTPSPRLSNLLEESFFSCATNSTLFGRKEHPFPIISTAGIRNASDVRMPDAMFTDFLKHLPMLPDSIVSDASVMVKALCSRGIIKDISFGDVVKELSSKPLKEVRVIYSPYIFL
jgi:hypothetical protein